MDVFDAEEDEIDTLAEADVYLAYRRFDKAEELLKSALSQEPGRRDYVMKLLEVYAASENVEAFVQQAEALAAGPEGAAGETWNKVVSMGRVLAADHPLFAGSESADDARSAEPTDDVSEVQDTLPDIDLAPLATDNEASGGDDQTDIALEAFARLDEGDVQTAVTETDQVSEQEAEDPGLESDVPLDFDLNELQNNETADEPGIVEASADDEDLGSIDADMDAEKISSLDEGATADEGDPEAGTDQVASQEGALSVSTEAQGGLESVAEELRQTTQELSADISTGDNVLSFSLDESPADTAAVDASEDGGSEAALGGELEADIDWLANISEDDNLDAELADLDSESELISGEDEISTKLDLARAYIDMGDQASARGILDEVLQEGSDDQKGEAEDLIRQIA